VPGAYRSRSRLPCSGSALGYLTVGVTLGALLLVHKGLGVAPWTLRLLPAHLECVLFGWTVQLGFGVAF